MSGPVGDGDAGAGSAGGVPDVVRRLRLALPERWFADDAPVLDSLLGGWAAAWSGVWAQLGAVRRDMRLATAGGAVLDAAALDFFGARVRRGVGEGDAPFRARLLAAMARPRVTRAALAGAVAEAGGTARVFEPLHPRDTGAWGVAGYGVAGRWGCVSMPGQVLLDVDGGDPDAVRAAVLDALPAGVVAWVRVG